jgi:hypothetical protein
VFGEAGIGQLKLASHCAVYAVPLGNVVDKLNQAVDK